MLTNVDVYYIPDPAQTSAFTVQYYFDGVHNPTFDSTSSFQAAASVGVVDLGLPPASVPGYTLANTPSSPGLPQTAHDLANTTVLIYYTTDPLVTATIDVGYYFNGFLDADYDFTINPPLTDPAIEVADVELEATHGSVPQGYLLDAITPTSPVLPQSASALNETAISVYYVSDPSQTATITIEYYFDGVQDTVSHPNRIINPQVLTQVNISDVELVPLPSGYMLDTQATDTPLPDTAANLDEQTIKVYYVADPDQKATINVGYHFDGVLDPSYSTTLNPQLVSSVTEQDVLLSAMPTGYMLADPATSVSTWPQIASALQGQTIDVYYVTDPAQTATVTVAYWFDGAQDAAYPDVTLTPQVLETVALSNVALSPTPLGYMLDAPATSVALPAAAADLDGLTVDVYYVADPSRTATIDVGYYFNNVLDQSRSATLTPQILSEVSLADVALASVPQGYVLASTTPALPAGAQALNGTTVRVDYVTDPAQTATVTVAYWFDGAQDAAYPDVTLTPQVLETVALSNVALSPTPPGYMLDAPATSVALPAAAADLDGLTVDVYYVSVPGLIEAHDFRYALATGNLDADDAKLYAGVLAYDGAGNPVPLSSVTVDAAQLAAINAAIAEGDRSGNPYPLTFTTPGGDTVTIEVMLYDAGGPSTPGVESIFANGFHHPVIEGAISASDAFVRAQVVAFDSNGDAIPVPVGTMPFAPGQVTVDAVQLAAINAAVAANDDSGNPYPLTFIAPGGTSVTVNVVLIKTDPGEIPTGEGSEGTFRPQTGDALTAALPLTVTALVAAGVLLAVRRRRKAPKRDV